MAFLPHSYAVVNQWQLLALARRADVGLKVIDAPSYHPEWKSEEGLFEPEQEQELRSFQMAEPDEEADALLRIFARSDFSPSRFDRTAVFGTCECQLVQRKHVRDPAIYHLLKRGSAPSDIAVVTPSRWSAEGYYKAGFTSEQVHIIPHGVDIETFHPMPTLRNSIRSDMGIGDSDFVFLAVGAMTGNKGIDLLLQAFAVVSRRFAHARLMLKGLDALYPSTDFLAKAMSTVVVQDQQRMVEKISYFGEVFLFSRNGVAISGRRHLCVSISRGRI